MSQSIDVEAVYSISSPEELRNRLDEFNYLADEGLSTALYLSLALGRPILLEGEAGVGKTEVAKTLARWLGVEVIRLQCYEGIDSSQAVYEWDYSRQLLHLRANEVMGTYDGSDIKELEDQLFQEKYLVRRPLLQALDASKYLRMEGGVLRPPVLLIDEIDRADDEFEAFLLEMLSEYSVSIPELGVLSAPVPPITVITSNRTRDLHDALKRRCFYHWVEHPSFDREVAIILRRAPQVSKDLALQVAAVTMKLRDSGLYKPPGIAETLDWAQALALLGESRVTSEVVSRTLGALLKYREDEEKVRGIDISEVVRLATLQSSRS